MYEKHIKKSGLFSGGAIYSKTQDLDGKLTKTAVNSQLQANDIVLNSTNNIDAVGVDIQANNLLNVNAKNINIKNATNTEETYSKHVKLKLGLGGGLNFTETYTKCCVQQ